MKLDKYLKIILTIIALCLVWLSVKDAVIGSNALYGSTQARPQVPKPTPEEIEKYKAKQEVLKRWQFMGRGIDWLEERGGDQWESLFNNLIELIKAGYVPRFSFGPGDILVFEKVK
jgi:hypothetical protein